MNKYYFLICLSLSVFFTYAQSSKSDSIFAQGVELYNAGKYEEAIPAFEQLLAIDSILYRESRHQKIIYSGMWLGHTLFKLGREKEALNNKYTKLYYKATPIDHRCMVVPDSLSNEARRYVEEGNYEKAIELYMTRKNYVDSVINPNHIWAVNSNLIIAQTYQKIINRDLSSTAKTSQNKMIALIADSLFDEYLNGVKNYYGESSEEFLYYVLSSGDFYKKSLFLDSKRWIDRMKYANSICRKYKKGEEDNESILQLAIAEKNYAQYYDGEYITMCFDQEKRNYRLHYVDSIYNHSLSLFNEFLKKCDKNIHVNRYVNILAIIEEIYWRRPNIDEKIGHGFLNAMNDVKFYDLQDSIDSKTQMIAEDINQNGIAQIVGSVLSEDSATEVENRWHDKAREICLQRIGILTKHDSLYEDLYWALDDMQDYYEYDNDYKNALQFAIKKQDLANNRGMVLQYHVGFSEIASIYEKLEEFEKAIKQEIQYLQISKNRYKNQDEGGRRTAIKRIIDYSFELLKKDKDSTNFVWIDKAFSILKDNEYLFEDVSDKISLYDLIAVDLIDSRSYYPYWKEAIKYHELCFNLCEELGLKKINYARSVANCYNILGDFKNFFAWEVIIFNLLQDRELRNFLYADKSLREYVWDSDIDAFMDFVRITYYNPSSEAAELAFNVALFVKGLLLNSDVALKEAFNDKIKNDSKIREIYNSWIKNGSESSINEERNLLLALKDLQYNQHLKVAYNDVMSKLGENDIAIEFLKVNYKVVMHDSVAYVAIISKSKEGYPKIVPLFKQFDLPQNSINLYHSNILTNLIWKPLENELESIKNIYFSPDGELFNISIESLPHWNQPCLMSDKWNMYRLSSTRQLAVNKEKNSLKQASVFGGVKYDTKENLLLADSKRYQSRERSFSNELFEIADSLNLRSGAAYLPATKIEAEEIERTLEQKKIVTNLLIDTLATEGAFKDLSGKKINLLHIATHGFYWQETDAKRMTHLNFLMVNDNQPRYVEDKALTRSGLLLAGANNALMGKKLPEGVDDGILTAKEISQLDLRGLDLVVLSACETGLGEIKGDGVFGLQRGFKKAGANSLLMSLWKVDDNATQLLMTQFYKNLTSGMSKFESLRQAQKYVRDYEVEVEVKSDIRPVVSAHAKEQVHQNANKETTIKKLRKYEDPKYWAAFILLDAID